MRKKEIGVEDCPDCGGKLSFLYKTGNDETWRCEKCCSVFYLELEKPPSQEKLF